MDGRLCIPELEKAVSDLPTGQFESETASIEDFLRNPRVIELITYLLDQVEPRESKLKLQYDIAHLMISECENSVEDFLRVLQRHYSCLDEPAGPDVSLAFASRLGTGAQGASGLAGEARGLGDEEVLELLKDSFKEPVRKHRKDVLNISGDTANYFNLGGYGSSKRCGITRLTDEKRKVTETLNLWLRAKLPDHTWTSLCVSHNQGVTLHADNNLRGSLNHTISLGDYVLGGLWVESPGGTEERSFDNEEGPLLGEVVSTRGQVFSFDARHRHASEPRDGDRWVVTAYSCRRLQDFSRGDLSMLGELGFPVPEVHDEAVMEVYNGVRIMRWTSEWNGADGGIYVGRGDSHLPTSIFCESYRPSIPLECAQVALMGRPLYVKEDETQVAHELIDHYGLGPGVCWTDETWKRWLRFWLGRGSACSIAFVGLVLKMGLGAKPGQLATFIRCLSCCARKQFKANPVELLPIPVPEASSSLLTAQELMLCVWESGGPEDSRLEQVREAAEQVGEECWTFLQISLINFLYCGGGKGMLGQVMLHSIHPTSEQSVAIQRFREYAGLIVEAGSSPVSIDAWEVVRQALGDIYAGKEVQKAYKLTWKSISPHVPGPGEAGRIDLVTVVSQELKPYVEDPELLRIPNEELVDVRLSAPVLVESDAEYDVIVENLCKAGMFEREEKSETLRVRGEPILNGMFGVHKAWKQDDRGEWYRTLRLIINLIPSNRCQSRMPTQPSKSMGYAPLWGQISLMEDEVIMCYAEDIKHCFHIFSPGRKWRGYFVLSKKAAGRAFGDGRREPGRPRVRSAPMGWSNIVDFIQDGLENMGTLAGIPAERVVKMGEPSPLMPLTTPRDYFSFYVDNFDAFKIIAETDVGLYEGKPSDEQLRLREVFKVWEVGRDPSKSAEGTLTWASLGAEQLGQVGLVGSARKLRCAILGACLNLLGTETVRCGSQELLSLVGKGMHSVQFCRPLACLFDSVYRDISQRAATCPISSESEEELLLLCLSIPLHWLDQRLAISPTVYATDASPDGGGACCTTGLSVRGRARCRMLVTSDDMGGSNDSVLVIEVFGGIGGLRKSLELIGLVPQGIVFIETNPTCLKLVRKHCAFVQTVDDIRKVTESTVLDWRRQFPKVKTVVFGGGWPSSGARSETNGFLSAMMQIRSWLGTASSRLHLPPWEIVEIYEQVVLEASDLASQCDLIGFEPWFCDAAQTHWCRRPRLWWLRNLPLLRGSDLQITPGECSRSHRGQPPQQSLHRISLRTQRPPLAWFLEPHSTKLLNDEEPFLTFIAPHPKQGPPSSAAGLAELSGRVLGRWKGDAWRVPPFQYQDANMVRTPSSVRRPLSIEQLRMLGFNTNHLDLKPKLAEDHRGQLVSTSWPVVLAARLLVGLTVTESQARNRDLTYELWEVWKAEEDRQTQLYRTSWSQRFGPEAGGRISLESFRGKGRSGNDVAVRFMQSVPDTWSDEQLLVHLVARNVTHKGTDVRLDLQAPLVASDFCRRSLDPTLWQWKVVMSHKWRRPGHITLLETIAVLDLLKRQVRKLECHRSKILVLIDNQAVIGILTKGRSSARQLQSPLRRICALLLGGHCRLLLAWVKSEWNPADGPSRWVSKRASRDA